MQIVQMVRALRMTPAELSTFLNGKQESPLKAAPAASTTNTFTRQEDTENE